jgi:hypothetical protein
VALATVFRGLSMNPRAGRSSFDFVSEVEVWPGWDCPQRSLVASLPLRVQARGGTLVVSQFLPPRARTLR